MVIHCLFIVRSKKCGPELLVAWDEFSVDENFEGWEEDCHETLTSLQGEYTHQTYVDIELQDSDLEEKLYGSELQGKVI